MADRPGDPDAALIRYALEGAGISGLAATAALDRIEARLSEAEREKDDARAAAARQRKTVSVYEQALRQIAEPMPDREGDWGSETDDWERVARAYRGIARAALTTEPGQEASGG